MKLELEVSEVDAVLALLSERPYREVSPLIHKILQQANDPVLQQVVGPDPVVMEVP